jgi:Fe-S cluster assembly protein SufD
MGLDQILAEKKTYFWGGPDRLSNRPGSTRKGSTIRFSGKKKQTHSIVVPDTMDQLALRLSFGPASNVEITLVIHRSRMTSWRLVVYLAKAANVTVNEIFLDARKPLSLHERQMTLQEDARLHLVTGMFPDHDCHLVDRSRLIGENAKIEYLTLGVATKNHEIKLDESMIHQAKSTQSTMENYLIATEAGVLECTVTGAIDKGMEKSACRQSNRGLLMGEHSMISVDPKLLIDEYDVEASHGAAIGRIDDDQLFYFESRGLDEDTAKQLIVQGYIAPFLDSIGDKDLEKTLRRSIQKQLSGGAK